MPYAIPGVPPGDDMRAQDWSVIKLLEEYDPLKLDEVSRPHAFVADHVVRVDLSASIVEEIQKYEEMMKADRDPAMTAPSSDETGRKKASKKPGWLEKLRDQLQRGEPIKWFIVVNGDEIRDWSEDGAADGEEEEEEPIQEEYLPQPAEPRHALQHYARGEHQQLVFDQAETMRTRDELRKARSPVTENFSLPLRPLNQEEPDIRPKTPGRRGFRRLFSRSNLRAPDMPN
jgi:hypothetical protein